MTAARAFEPAPLPRIPSRLTVFTTNFRLQMCVMTENGPVLSSMEAELRERAMKLAGFVRGLQFFFIPS